MDDLIVNVRGCRASDLKSVYEIEKTCHGTTGALPILALTQYKDLFGSGFLVGESASQIIGFAIGGIALGEGAKLAWVLDVAVLPSFEGRHVASTLCEHLLTVLESCEVLTVRATVAPENVRSLKLFRRLGFSVIDDIPDYFGPRERRLLLERSRIDIPD